MSQCVVVKLISIPEYWNSWMVRCCPRIWRFCWGHLHKVCGIEYGSPEWEPTVLTTKPLVHVSLWILRSLYIQLQVLKWPRAHFTSRRLCKTFFLCTLPLPRLVNTSNKTKANHHHSPSCSQKVWGEAYHSFTTTQHPHFSNTKNTRTNVSAK